MEHARLAHGFEGFGLAVEGLKDSQELCDLQEISHTASEVEQFELTLLIADGREGSNKLP